MKKKTEGKGVGPAWSLQPTLCSGIVQGGGSGPITRRLCCVSACFLPAALSPADQILCCRPPLSELLTGIQTVSNLCFGLFSASSVLKLNLNLSRWKHVDLSKRRSLYSICIGTDYLDYLIISTSCSGSPNSPFLCQLIWIAWTLLFICLGRTNTWCVTCPRQKRREKQRLKPTDTK